jgi:hypothetical protein
MTGMRLLTEFKAWVKGLGFCEAGRVLAAGQVNRDGAPSSACWM